MKVKWGDGLADLFLHYDRKSSTFRVLNYEKDTSEIHRLAGGKNVYRSLTGFTGEGYIERLNTLIPIGGYRVECHDGWTYGPSVMTKAGAVAIFAPTNNSHRSDKEFIPYQNKPLIARKGNKLAFFSLDKEGGELLLNILRGDWPKEEEVTLTLKKGVAFFNQLSSGDWEVDFKEVQMEVYTSEPKWRPKIDLWAFFEFPSETQIPNWLYNWGDEGPLLAKDISVCNGRFRPVDKPLVEEGSSGRTAATMLAYEQNFGINSVITYICASWPNDGLGAEDILREAGWTACTTHDECGACYWKYHRGRVTAMIVGNEVEAASKKIKRFRKTEKISSEEEEFILSSIFGTSGWDDCSLGYHSATVSQAEWALSSREITRRLFQEFYENLEEKILRAREAWKSKK